MTSDPVTKTFGVGCDGETVRSEDVRDGDKVGEACFGSGRPLLVSEAYLALVGVPRW